MKRCLPLLLLAPLALLATEERHTYRCDNGSPLDISFSADADGRPQATLHFADGAISLPQVPSASGSRYRRAPVSLQTQGDEIMLEDGQDNRRHCRRNAPPAAASGFVEIAGSVRYRASTALPANAELVIRVRSGAITLAEQRYQVAGVQMPIPFAATVDRDLLAPGTVVAARIEVAGKLRLSGQQPYSAEQPRPLTIELRPLMRERPTPGKAM